MFFKIKKVHFLVSELYIYRNARCNNKKSCVKHLKIKSKLKAIPKTHVDHRVSSTDALNSGVKKSVTVSFYMPTSKCQSLAGHRIVKKKQWLSANKH